MTTNDLENKWQLINIATSGKYNYQNIDSACHPDLNIGVNDLGNRCLLLVLPNGYNPGFIGEKKENITTIFNSTYNFIILELTDNYYRSLFVDLVLSLYFKIKDISDYKDSTKVFIKTINLWSLFLQEEKSDKLSENTIKGLFGELSLLHELITKANSSNINDILNSWQGPYDRNHDFYLDGIDYEVKTKNNTKTDIYISSEYQLEEENGVALELVVVSVEKLISGGSTIDSLITAIRNDIINLNGDISILFLALKKKSITLKNLSDYNAHQFKIIKHNYYKCTDVDFPRITTSQIKKEISSLTYKINLVGLDKFISYTKIY
jgi:hypothetical protein